MTLEQYLFAQHEWSERTFGPGMRTVGLTRHIEKECDEIRANPDDKEEWIDVIILALEGYWRAGGDADNIMWDLRAKQEKNFARKWPVAGRPEDQPVEHVR